MQLKPATENDDKNRFYAFVSQYQRDHGCEILGFLRHARR